jgi:hypothetical protein
MQSIPVHRAEKMHIYSKQLKRENYKGAAAEGYRIGKIQKEENGKCRESMEWNNAKVTKQPLGCEMK